MGQHIYLGICIYIVIHAIYASRNISLKNSPSSCLFTVFAICGLYCYIIQSLKLLIPGRTFLTQLWLRILRMAAHKQMSWNIAFTAHAFYLRLLNIKYTKQYERSNLKWCNFTGTDLYGQAAQWSLYDVITGTTRRVKAFKSASNFGVPAYVMSMLVGPAYS